MCYDTTIIGAGPAGLTAGIYARTRDMRTLILDASKVGGQLLSLYPEKGVHNYPGFETIQARKLSDKLYAQAESLECDIHEDEKVETIESGEECFVIKTNRSKYETKSVIIAIGMGMFRPKKMGAVGEDKFEGKGLEYVLPPKAEIVGKKVVMFGGGNSAIDMALVAATVTETTLIHRKDVFRADETTVKALSKSRVKTEMSATLVSVNGNEAVESVTIKRGEETFDLPADLVVINIGISANLGDLDTWGIELTKSGLVKVDFDMRTNRPGIFACGDVVDYEGKYKQIITACGEAATACNSAYKFVKKPYWA